jgi:L-lactate dehydrogenase (cytochrome)
MKAASLTDYRELARRRLPHFLFEYIDGGAGAEATLRHNVEDLARIALRQRVLRPVGSPELATTLFGQTLRLPVVLGPIGLGGLTARRGEVTASRAAAAAGVPFCLSTVSACGLDEVVRGSPAPPWFQLYMIRDRAFMRDLLAKARDSGCGALVFTVDMPIPGTRYRDVRSGLAGAPGLRGQLRRLCQALARPRWAWNVGLHGRPHNLGNVAPVLGSGSGLEDYFAWMRDNFDPGVGWDDLDWVRASWPGPLIVKGILDVEDARQAVAHGADGIIVSNHGGRQLDGVPSTARALPAIAAAVGGQTTVLADGGVRSGLDVVRLLALGARGVLLGRAWVYALAGGGEAGVAHVLRLIETEMRVAMVLTGVARVADIDARMLVDAYQGAER